MTQWNGDHEEADEAIEWLLSRPDSIKRIMRILPPGCLVRATRDLACPAPGEIGQVFSYTESGQVSVVVGDMRGFCKPEWLEIDSCPNGMTPDLVAQILDGVDA